MTDTRLLGLEPPPPADTLRDFLGAHTACPGLASGVLRLLAVDRTLRVLAEPWAAPEAGPVELGVSRRTRRFSGNPLNRFKTFAYLENRLLAREAEEQGWFDALALNEHGQLTDGGRTSVFLLLDGRLKTPPVAAGALPGVARACLLAVGLADEAPLDLADLERAEAVLLTNSLRGGIPVRRIHASGEGPMDLDPCLLQKTAEALGR